jgi:hypothetical protein
MRCPIVHLNLVSETLEHADCTPVPLDNVSVNAKCAGWGLRLSKFYESELKTQNFCSFVMQNNEFKILILKSHSEALQSHTSGSLCFDWLQFVARLGFGCLNVGLAGPFLQAERQKEGQAPE